MNTNEPLTVSSSLTQKHRCACVRLHVRKHVLIFKTEQRDLICYICFLEDTTLQVALSGIFHFGIKMPPSADGDCLKNT